VAAFVRVMQPFTFMGFLKGAKLGSLNIEPEDLFTEMVKAALKQKTLEHAMLSVGTTKEALQGLLDTAITEGQGITELAREIEKQFDVDSRVRSKRIARTELTDSINDGTLRMLIREGYTQKEWSTVIDGRERPTHASANGQTVGVYEQFSIGGGRAMHPGDDNLPAEERIQCRCVLVGAGIPQDRKQKLGEMFLRVHGRLEISYVVQLHRAFLAQRDRILSHFPS